MKSDFPLEDHHDTSFALHIIPPLHSNKEHAIALEATMQSLVLDRQHPIALELAGTPERRSFIVRATSQAALEHVDILLRAQYPQSEIRPLAEHEDPFRLDADEDVTAIELVAGTAAYLPLRTWKDSQKDGSDPLLGLLAALSRLPDGTRVIAQLSLMPAVSNWSRASLRRAVENPLAPERDAIQRKRIIGIFSDNLSNTVAVNIGLLGGFLFLIRSWIPSWVQGALLDLATGKGALVSAAHMTLLIVYVGVLVLLEFLMVGAYALFKSMNRRQALYDPHVVGEKVSRMAYRTRLRLYAIGPKTKGKTTSAITRLASERVQSGVRSDLLLRMVAAYRQFHMANGAFFVPKRISHGEATSLLKSRAARMELGWPKGLRRSRHMISVDSLATLWHMPHPSALPELALVEHRRSRTLLIPPAVTRQCQGLVPIGYSDHAGYHQPFALTPEFYTFHTLIAGKAGEGKSVFIQHIAQRAMQLGGLVLIDPFGDLCEDVLRLVPAHRAEDVVFIDLSDTTASVGLNPLDVTIGRGRDKFIADLLKMLAQIWVSSWGAKMENAFEMSLRTLFEANKILVAQDPQRGPGLQYTLLDILPLLTNANFCHALLQQVQDDYLHRWWREYYEPLSLVQQRDVINPIAAKVSKFESLIARRILGQSVSTLNISQMIEDRKIILFKLAKGIVGSEVSSMIGATLLGLIQSTLEEQGREKRMQTTRLPIILDEFQRVAGADYRTLSELHKYGATFFLSTQSLEYLQKLNSLLLPTLQANVRQTIAFNMSSPDATLLSKDLGVDMEDILHLDINTCYVSVPAAGRRQPTFSLNLKAAVVENSEVAESIRTRCRVRYTSSIADIDARLSEAMLRSIRMVPEPNPPQLPVAPPSYVPEQLDPLPSLTLSLPFETLIDPSSQTSPLVSGSEEASREGAAYRAERDRASEEASREGAARAERDPEEAVRESLVYRAQRSRTSEEGTREGAAYRAERDHGSEAAVRRSAQYQVRNGEWSNQEDISRMTGELPRINDSLAPPMAGEPYIDDSLVPRTGEQPRINDSPAPQTDRLSRINDPFGSQTGGLSRMNDPFGLQGSLSAELLEELELMELDAYNLASAEEGDDLDGLHGPGIFRHYPSEL